MTPQRSIPHDFDTVDEKVKEAEWSLQQMVAAGRDQVPFRHAFSAFVAVARNITLALQRFNYLPGFAQWYEPHRQRLREDALAQFFLDERNELLHGGPSPVTRMDISPEEVKHYFHPSLGQSRDVVSICREYLLVLLQIVYDCYVKLGIYIDPQQYFTQEHFTVLGKTIDDAEIQVYGWVCTHLIEEGFNEEGRWLELRSHVGECEINHLFYAYLGKPTPQPHLSEEAQEIDYSPEDRGCSTFPRVT